MSYDDSDLSLAAYPHRLYRLIADLALLHLNADQRLLEQFNLTNVQYRILNLLDREKGQRLIALSEQLVVPRSTVSRLIDEMEGVGWIKRSGDPRDRRAQQVTLTPSGANLREQAYAAHLLSLETRFNPITEAEQHRLADLMLTLYQHLRSLT